ncbi:MAG: biotin/lipoyl-binding carrier protein [Acetobacteraceae bacterium]|nr:biotin/lipoyl-binding carrier protein [Acetobacteraceae bacterium]
MANTNVTSELNANVWKIEVKLGDQVAEDDILIILESMKMEIPVTAPKAGTIHSISVNEGDAVTEGQVLVVLG